jgi:single-strand DNA-binding protein
MSNSFCFTGNLARDAEKKFLPSGTAILSFSVANSIGYGDKKQTLWIRVSVFGKRAEGQLSNFLLKGTTVFCAGELSLNEYKANDGTTKTSLELVATVVDLVGKRPERDDTPVEYNDGIDF